VRVEVQRHNVLRAVAVGPAPLGDVHGRRVDEGGRDEDGNEAM
jgi:hypothetical protein